jgi:hypothetical protein
MMTPEEIYKVWAPESSIWSPWVAPVLLLRLLCPDTIDGTEEIPEVKLAWLESLAGRNSVMVVDLPGKESVETGIALARQGYRPVPLYNGVPGTGTSENISIVATDPSGATVDMAGLLGALRRATIILKDVSLTPDAPPAFLLDSDRILGNRPMAEGMFDNRWMVFPQNFPSGKFLLSHDIRNAVLVSRWTQPREDLAHILLRWQEAGIRIHGKRLGDDERDSEITISPPSRFRRAWYRALAIAGLRRNWTGGFGSTIPFSSAG